MKFAIISDIHGNLPAFQAVLNDLESQAIDEIILLGDYFCDSPWPNEVVDLIRNLPSAHVVRGNKEASLAKMETEDPACWVYDQFASMYWNYHEMTLENRRFLQFLPEKLTINRVNTKIFITHGSKTFFGDTKAEVLDGINYSPLVEQNPNLSHADYLLYAKNLLENDKALKKTLTSLPDGIYLFGHRHTQWFVEMDNKILINPGSCGLPLDHDTKAPYTLLTIVDGKWAVEERRVKYDIASSTKHFKSTSLFKASEIWSRLTIEALLTGRDYVFPFFDFVDQLAEEMGITEYPYPNNLWQLAGSRWFAGDKLK